MHKAFYLNEQEWVDIIKLIGLDEGCVLHYNLVKSSEIDCSKGDCPACFADAIMHKVRPAAYRGEI